MKVYIHSHALKHGLSQRQILYAWSNYIASQQRRVPREDQILHIGYDTNGTAIQMVGRIGQAGILIYHAMTPPTANVLTELGLNRRH